MCCWRQMALCGCATLGWQWTSHVRPQRVVWALWTTCLPRQEAFGLHTCLSYAFPPHLAFHAFKPPVAPQGILLLLKASLHKDS